MSTARLARSTDAARARLAGPLSVGVAVVAADQWTKTLASAALGRDAANHRHDLVGSAVAFEYVENSGAAFGILPGQGALLTIGALVIVAVLVWRFARSGRTSPLVALSLGLLAGGACGNIVDRIRLGYVIDFIAVGIWPRFNLADSAVTVGVLLLAWTMAVDDRTEWSAPPSRGGEGVRSGSYESG